MASDLNVSKMFSVPVEVELNSIGLIKRGPVSDLTIKVPSHNETQSVHPVRKEMGCEHRDCGAKERVWLPYKYRGMERGLKPHSFCIKCGLVKNSSSDRPRRLGYYINIVASLGEEVVITKAQMRLISKELEKNGIDDIYCMDKCCQEALFIKTIKRFVNVSEQAIRYHLSDI